MLSALKRVLEPDFDVVAMVDNAVSLIDTLRSREPGVIVLDISLGNNGLENLARHLHRRYPHLPIVTIGDDSHEGHASASLGLPYLRKSDTAASLVRVARETMQHWSQTESANELG